MSRFPRGAARHWRYAPGGARALVEPMAAEFVHLHVHSQFSFLVSTLKVSDLARHAHERGMGAVALTDLGNMFGTVRHWKKCKDAGIQPIVGCEMNVTRPGQHAAHVGLLAATDEGYRNLVQLVSMGYMEPAGEPPAVSMEQLAARAKGLIGLSGCLGGLAPQGKRSSLPSRTSSSPATSSWSSRTMACRSSRS
jgi:DNA polymerase III subunit alpha